MEEKYRHLETNPLQDRHSTSEQMNQVNKKKVFLALSGMTCSACSNTIEGALRNTQGVVTANVSLMNHSAEIVYDPSVVSPEQLITEVTDVGFDARLSESTARGHVVLHTYIRPLAASSSSSLSSGDTFSASSASSASFPSRSLPQSILDALPTLSPASPAASVGSVGSGSVALPLVDVPSDSSLAPSPTPAPASTSASAASTSASAASFSSSIPFPSSPSSSSSSPSVSPLEWLHARLRRTAHGSGKTASSVEMSLFRSKNKSTQAAAAAAASQEELEHAHAVVHQAKLIMLKQTGVISVTSTAVWDARERLADSQGFSLPTFDFDLELDEQTAGVRDIVQAIAPLGVVTTAVRTEGDVDALKTELADRRAEELRMWRKLFWTSMVFTTPLTLIMFCGPYVPGLHPLLMTQLYHKLSWESVIIWALTTPVQFGSGWHFFVNAWKSVRHGAATMDVLVALGSGAAYVYSLLSVGLMLWNAEYEGKVFFETSAMLISVILLGRLIESGAKGKTSEALSALMNLQAVWATVVTLDSRGHITHEREVAVNLVQRHDVILVKRGSKVPVDGVVLDGKTCCDESLVTGESMPVAKSVGSAVIGSTMNLDGAIQIRATGVGGQTVLAKIVSLVNQAQSNKAPIQAFADRVARYFVPTVCAFAFLTWVVWYTLFRFDQVPHQWLPPNVSEFLFSLLFGISVLVISCPCSLGLATPTAVLVGTSVAAHHGLLFKGGQPLEIAGRTTAVLFDKTGTLTEGRPSVNEDDTVTFHEEVGLSADALWTLIASAEAASEHLIAKAILTYAAKRKLVELVKVEESKAESGAGLSASLSGHMLVIGNERWMHEHKVTLSEAARARLTASQQKGNIAICVGLDARLAAVISIYDPIRPEAALVMAHLERLKVKAFMITGDSLVTARAVARQLGLNEERVFAQVSPKQKAGLVRQLQGQPEADDLSRAMPLPSEVVMFVGDGVNDSPALAQADVGVTIKGATDIAVETADVILMKADLTDLLTAIHLSKTVLRRIYSNFVWAFVYNVLAIPLAAGCFFPLIQMTLPPVVAAIAMGASSICVVLSSQLLKWYRKPDWVELHNNSDGSGRLLETISKAQLWSKGDDQQYKFVRVPVRDEEAVISISSG